MVLKDGATPIALFGMRLPGSRMIEEFTYAQASTELDVIFRSTGDVYRYSDVPAHVVMAMCATALSGESVGEYFITHVKTAFAYKKLS